MLKHFTRIGASSLLAIFAALAVLWFAGAKADEPARALPLPLVDANAGNSLETAVFAGGCFWGVEGVFQHVNGVKRVEAGYSGGTRETANYPDVTTETTGHAEAVRITYDPEMVTYGQLLRIFFSVAHDPTQLNRQGPDSGPSYRSVIFYRDAEQKRVAQAYIAQLDKAHLFSARIVTQLDPLKAFYPAEAYHQDFLVRHPSNPYIVANDLPKIANLKRLLPEYYRDRAVTNPNAW